MRPAIVPFVPLLCLCSCVESPAQATPLGHGEGALLRIEGADGSPAGAVALPRSPRFVLDLALAPPLQQSMWLLQGPPDDDLLADATRRPLRAATVARATALDFSTVDGELVASPHVPLSPGADHALLIPRWAVSDPSLRASAAAPPWAVALRVSSAPEDGAAVVAVLPADGTPDVPTNVSAILVALDGALLASGPALQLTTQNGSSVPASVDELPCAGFAPDAFACFVLTPAAALQPFADHRITLTPDARDGRDAPLPAWESSFRTAAGADPQWPATLALPCVLDESAAGDLCVLADDRSIAVRLRADEPVLVTGALDGLQTARPSPRGDAELRFDGLPSAHRFTLSLGITDLAGHRTHRELEVATDPPLAPISISELRSDPRGREPDQEWVELSNHGPAAVEVGGFGLSDDADEPGSSLPKATLQPGTAALVVGARFDPEDPHDAPIPAGTQLIRLDGPIGHAGLTNAGEPVYLRDAAGRRLSAAPALATGAGACLARTGRRLRSGEPVDFTIVQADACSPGQPPR